MLSSTLSSTKMRHPDQVMRLNRLGSMHQSRLSFMRILLRRLKNEKWTFKRPIFDFDEKGVGVAVYTTNGPQRSYSLICFGHDLKPEERSDRVIAHKWDSTFTLFDGVPNQADIDRLSHNIPKQEAGRVSNKELTISRANRSVRLFNYIVECLAAGNQPDSKECDAIGYLMRTTAVYGSGKLGAADRELIMDREEFITPFQAEMLSVYLIRTYSLDLVEHLAAKKSPHSAIPLAPEIRRNIGVGNSTGLGMAPYLINHPILLNNWVSAREEALARVCALKTAPQETVDLFKSILKRTHLNTNNWTSEHPTQIEKINSLKVDLTKLDEHIQDGALDQDMPWLKLVQWSEEKLGLEGQEQLISLIIEPFGDLVDDLADKMDADEVSAFPIDGSMTLAGLKEIIKIDYQWALKIDWSDPSSQARIWYISAEKLEPRLGNRFEEPLTPYEQNLAPGRDVKNMYVDLEKWTGDQSIVAFLQYHPEHRHILRRVQISANFKYAEIRDNTISRDLLPIDMLRFKLAFFGATHFDPRSDRWVRISMFKNAPFPHELSDAQNDDWSYPHLKEVTH